MIPDQKNMTGTSKELTAPAWEFFDLEKDPGETYNAIQDKEYAAIIQKMKTELFKLKKEAGDNDDQFPEMKKIIPEDRN